MASKKKARGRRGARAAAPTTAGTQRKDRGATVARLALGAAVLASSLLVDTRAEAAFEAPKRLASLLGIALAATALLVWPRGGEDAPRGSRPMPFLQRFLLVLVGLALAGALASAVFSPRREASLHAVRTMFLFGLLLPLGASRALNEGAARGLAAVFVAACAVNAAISLLQGMGLFQPFEVETLGGRANTAALVGNEGYLAVLLALAAPAALGLVLFSRRGAKRAAAGSALALLLAGLVINRNLTALSASLAGLVTLVAFLFRRRAVLAILLILASVGGGVAVYAPLRIRAAEVLRDLRSGEWDRALTYRAGPWLAAVEMARERPILGWGPGTFGAEFVPHRLRAEVRYRRRLLNPMLTSAYGEAHCDYLQAAAEAGIPVGGAAIGALLVLIASLVRATGRVGGRARQEAVVLLAMLVVGAAAGITWFPLQRALTAVPLLLAAGRAWRICGAQNVPGEG